MAGGVLCLEFSGSIFGICVLKTKSGVLPFLVYNCVNQYENLVSVHNVTDSADFGDLLFFGLWACFWVCLCDMALISEAISHKLAQKGVIVYLLDYLGHLVNPWPLWWNKTDD